MKLKKLILLIILDGLGIAKKNKGNAIWHANMKNIEKFKKDFYWVKAHASGKWVGLPNKKMGNSEVGHIHLGSGRINKEYLLLINEEIKKKKFYKNNSLLDAINNSKKYNSSFHIIGLFSDGGIHSHIDHIFEIYKIAIFNKLKDIYIHIFSDGRDTYFKSIKKYLKKFYKLKKKLKYGNIASIIGRYYSMDRDKKYNRIKKAYDMLISLKGEKFDNLFDFINKEYNFGRTDEFFMPGVNINTPNGYIKKNDSVIMTNFRSDRIISLSAALTNKNFPFNSDNNINYKNFFIPKISNIFFVSMLNYDDSVISKRYILKKRELSNCLGEWLSKKKYFQLRMAETEKISHVTKFFDGGIDYFKNGLAKKKSEILLNNADICLVPSLNIFNYDLKPEMSALILTNKLIENIKKNIFDFIILNFANCDMVGHTGNLNATIKAAKYLDNCLIKIFNIINSIDGSTMIITGDHGNSEIMLEKNNKPNKKHTSQKVPIIIITKKKLKLFKKNISISNLSPTILDLMGEEIPNEMTQKSLIKKK